MEDNVTVLHQFAVSCKYDNIKHKMIHDRLVVGIGDDLLSECLQMEINLTRDTPKKLTTQI